MFLLSYTREPLDTAIYDARLAFSLHLAISKDGKTFTALNHNSGLWFAKATENDDGLLNPKSLKNPIIFAKEDGTFGVVAIRTLASGEEDNEDVRKTLYVTTKDFVEYSAETLISLDEYNSYAKASTSVLRDSLLNIEGIFPSNVIEIPETLGDYLCKKLLTPENISIRVPEEITASCEEDVKAIRALAGYSDGGICYKSVDWDISKIDFNKPGIYEITGVVTQPHFDFPLAINRADPCVGRWNGKWYFIATNDADDNHTLYIREADTLEGLATAEEHLILDSTTYEGIGGLLWAPEFHIVNGKLYIFHACTPGEFFWEESHIMELKEGGNPVCKEDWSRPKRVVKADGSDICEAGKEITLDMTCFEWENDYYVVWSQRQFLPKDLGAWLYIAKLNADKPWMLASEPVVLSKPDFGWGNNHTFVEEGPFALFRNDMLYLTFSAAAVDSSYVVSFLKIQEGKDLLNPANWIKRNAPILTSRCVTNEYGTGHNAYVMDDFGNIWNTYHARPGVEGPRSTGIRRVHFDIDGEPMLDLTEDKDLKDELKNVKMKVRVE